MARTSPIPKTTSEIMLFQLWQESNETARQNLIAELKTFRISPFDSSVPIKRVVGTSLHREVEQEHDIGRDFNVSLVSLLKDMCG